MAPPYAELHVHGPCFRLGAKQRQRNDTVCFLVLSPFARRISGRQPPRENSPGNRLGEREETSVPVLAIRQPGKEGNGEEDDCGRGQEEQEATATTAKMRGCDSRKAGRG